MIIKIYSFKGVRKLSNKRVQVLKITKPLSTGGILVKRLDIFQAVDGTAGIQINGRVVEFDQIKSGRLQGIIECVLSGYISPLKTGPGSHVWKKAKKCV